MKNLRKTALLATVAVALSWPVAAATPTKDSDRFLTEAMTFAREGDPAAAAIQLKNALREDPNNFKARYELARIYMLSGDFPQALQELEILKSRGYDDAQVMLPLGETYYAVGRYRDVLTKIDAEKVEGPVKANVLALQARAHVALNDPQSAKALLDKALAINPTSTGALYASAALLRAEGKPAEAEAQVDKALTGEMDHPDILILKAGLRRDQSDDAGAMIVFNALVAKYPDYRAARLERALTNLIYDRASAAKADIDYVLEREPKNQSALYLQAYYMAREKKFADATRTLLALPEFIDSYAPAAFLLARSALNANQLETALTYATQYASRQPADANGIQLLAAVHIRMNAPVKAIALLEPLLTEKGNDPQLHVQLASAYFAAGRNAEAVKLFERSLAAQPDNNAARLSLALARMQSGAMDQGIAELEKLMQTAPSDDASAALVLALIQSGKTDRALVAATDVVKASPDKATGYNLQGTVHLAARKPDAAAAAFNVALQKDPRHVPALLNLAQIEERAGRRAEAVAWYQRALDVEPNSMTALDKLATLAVLDNRPDQAIAHLEQAIKRDPAAVGPRVRLIDMLSARKDHSRALAAARDFVAAVPGNLQATDAMGRAQIAAGDYAGALATYRQIAARFPDLAEGHRRAAQVLMATAAKGEAASPGMMAEARVSLDKALELAPDDTAVLDNRITWEQKVNGAPAAVAYAKKLSQERPKSSERLLVLGDIQAKTGNTAEALVAYRAAWDQTKSPATLQRLYEGLMQAKRADDAHALVKGWIDANPTDHNARFLLASHYLATGQTDLALRETESMNGVLPDNPILLNNLAWLYGDKDPKRAIAYAEQANVLAPGSPDILDTLGWLYVAHGDPAKGETLLARAYSLAPARPDIAYRYAAALDKRGDRVKAKELLQQLLADTRVFTERKQAQALLAKLGG